ncbi:hypothetical protein QIW49_03490 [Francisellaceae bacterium CB300]
MFNKNYNKIFMVGCVSLSLVSCAITNDAMVNKPKVINISSLKDTKDSIGIQMQILNYIIYDNDRRGDVGSTTISSTIDGVCYSTSQYNFKIKDCWTIDGNQIVNNQETKCSSQSGSCMMFKLSPTPFQKKYQVVVENINETIESQKYEDLISYYKQYEKMNASYIDELNEKQKRLIFDIKTPFSDDKIVSGVRNNLRTMVFNLKSDFKEYLDSKSNHINNAKIEIRLPTSFDNYEVTYKENPLIIYPDNSDKVSVDVDNIAYKFIPQNYLAEDKNIKLSVKFDQYNRAFPFNCVNSLT